MWTLIKVLFVCVIWGMLLNHFLTSNIHVWYGVYYQMNVRKLMLEDTLLEYDYGGPNTRHDPKKGRPGTGKNPWFFFSLSLWPAFFRINLSLSSFEHMKGNVSVIFCFVFLFLFFFKRVLDRSCCEHDLNMMHEIHSYGDYFVFWKMFS